MIRKADLNDLDDMVAIENEWQDYPKWGKNGFLKEFEKNFSRTFVFVDDDTIYGFINFWELDDIIEINSIVVSHRRLRSSIGSMLIDFAIDCAKKGGCKRIILDVNEKNIPAISLYKKKGFRVYNTRKKYYDLKYDSLLMELVIDA